MARKVFIPTPDHSASDAPAPDDERPPLPPRTPLAKGGAGAPRYMQGSVDAASDRSHEDIPLDHIQGSPIEDRIDLTEDIEMLMASIEANGQQIPITVRIVNLDRPYEIVAGRRRLEAIRRLGRSTIRGFVTRMTDDEAFVAQGIENSARLETSFIERARTAVMAAEAGFPQNRIAEFLAIQPSMVSMMTSIYGRIGESLVKAIGPARGIGRRKWERLSRLLDQRGLDATDVVDRVDTSIQSSPDRFEALVEILDDTRAVIEPPSRLSPKPPVERSVRHHKRRRYFGGALTSVQAPGRLTIRASTNDLDGFLEYVSSRLEGLRTEFETDSETETADNIHGGPQSRDNSGM